MQCFSSPLLFTASLCIAMKMASFAQQFSGLRCPPLASSPLFKPSSAQPKIASLSFPTVTAVGVNSTQVKERQRMRQLFDDAYERCVTAPMEGVPFTVEDFHAALDKYDFDNEIGTKIKGTVFSIEANGALVDITAKSSAYLPVQEACIHRIKHVHEAGIFPGFQEEFVIVGENEADDSLILSLRSMQYDLAWERCRQLQAEDVVVKGKVVSANKGGVVVLLDGLRGFVPFSQISMGLKQERGHEAPIDALLSIINMSVVRLNEFGQPIGAGANLLSSYLGIIARDGQKTPINYFD